MPSGCLYTRYCPALRQHIVSSYLHCLPDFSISSAEQIGNEVIRTQWLCVMPPLNVTDEMSHILSAVVPKSGPLSSVDEH